MSEDIRWKQRFDNFTLALGQLTLAVEQSRQRALSDLEKQGLIQVFKFVHELAWNVLKDYLEYEGVKGIVGSRDAAREAFKRALIDDSEVWMDMIAKRNLTSHAYNQELAEELVNVIIEGYHSVFLALQKKMRSRA